MANYKVVDADKLDVDLTAVADAIREKTGGMEKLTLDDMPEQIGGIKSYSEGYEAGQTEGIEQGYAAGQQAEYDRFWDAYQENGNRTKYERGFYGPGWTDDNFKPKYLIVLTGNIYNIFDESKISYIDESIVDCSKATLLQYFLSNNASGKPVTAIMDISSCKNMVNTFIYSGNLETVELKNIREDCAFINTFLACVGLVNFRCTGTIGRDLNLSESRLLSDESVQNIIYALADLTGQTAQTLIFHADVGAKLTQAQKDAISGKNWTLVY